MEHFKERLRRGDLIVGTWIKTPSQIVTEVLASTALDVLCLDAEHAPFDRLTLDACVLACRSNAMPVLIRVPCAAPDQILNALDIGSTGVVVPHVTNRLGAEAMVRASQYGPGGRGYAGSSRAAHYTRKVMAEYLAETTAQTVIVAQIEDREGVDNIDEIAANPDIDALFIGRADLAVSYAADGPDAGQVIAAAERVCAASRTAGKTVGMFLSRPAEFPRWRALGVSFYLLESDHVFLLRGAAALVSLMKSEGTSP